MDKRIEVLLSEKDARVEPAFLSFVKKEPHDIPNIEDNIVNDNLNLDLSVHPVANNSQSGLVEKDVRNEEKMLISLSNPQTSSLTEDIYIKCFNTAVERLNITEEKEKLEAKRLLNSTIRNSKLIKIWLIIIFKLIFCFVLVINITVQKSSECNVNFSDENLSKTSLGENTPDDIISLSSLSSSDEEIIENNSFIPQCAKLPNYLPSGYRAPQFNFLYGYQYFPHPPNYPGGPPSLSANSYKSKPLYDRHKNENLLAELKKYK